MRIGHQFEMQVLTRSSARDFSTGTYMPYKAAYRFARRNQPPGWCASNPCSWEMRELLNNLRNLVRDARAKNSSLRSPNLSVFVATDTPLDYQHGVDCFIEWTEVVNGSRTAFYITIDLTRNAEKRAGAGLINISQKADFILSEQDLTPVGLTHIARLMLRLLIDRRQLFFGRPDWAVSVRYAFARFGHSAEEAEKYVDRVRLCGPINLEHHSTLRRAMVSGRNAVGTRVA